MEAPVLRISPDGEYLALSCLDGTLKLWESNTGSLSQEYVPSSHLSSTCTCLSWSPKLTVSDPDTPSASKGSSKKKKKRKSELGTRTLELIAFGTTAGSVLLYNRTTGDLHAEMLDTHKSKVNAVCWSHDGSSFFSCSDDRFIAEWSLSKHSPKSKWKADDNPVHCIAVLQDCKQLLSASREIKLWNLESKDVLKVYTGHSTQVQWLIPVISDGADGNSSTSSLQSYFLSATTEDRHISVWQTSSSNTKSALASFSLDEEPAYIHVAPPRNEGCPFILVAVTKSGTLQLYEHTLNGRMRKPLKPKFSLQIASETNVSNSNPHKIPILCAHINDDNEEMHVLVAYGTSLKPVFEKIQLSSLEKFSVLIRQDPSTSRLQAGDPESRLKPTDISKDVTVLAPGFMAPSGPSVASNDKPTKRKKGKPGDMTMEERLTALGMDRPEAKSKQLPKADTLCTLLAQGLQSQDKKILNHVLQHNDKTIIRNTVQRLPLQVIVPLVMELSKRMHKHAQSAHQLMKWVQAVLTIHTSYLMSFPEIIDSFSSLYQMMENRVKAFSQLSRLQGKLNLMLSQVSAQAQEEEEGASGSTQQPMLLYQDESSSDEMDIDEFAPDSSESDDNWEELSDMDTPLNGSHDKDDTEDDEDG